MSCAARRRIITTRFTRKCTAWPLELAAASRAAIARLSRNLAPRSRHGPRSSRCRRTEWQPDPFGLNNGNGNGHAAHAQHDGHANGAASEWSVAHGYVPQHTSAKGDLPDPVEPIYGPTYLPRKFKTAIGLPGDNCVDLYANDLGLMAICENYRIVGYNVLVGGGMGVTPSADKTFPAVAKRMAFVAARSGDRRRHGR